MALNASFQMPRSQTPVLSAGGIMDKDWYRFLVSLYNSATRGLPQREETIAVGASPFTYQAVLRGQLLIVGGTVSAVAFSRDGTTFYSAGITAGFLQMDQADYVRVTYSVLPALLFFPM